MMRLARALRRYWLRLVLGMASGLYVAVACVFALLVIVVNHGGTFDGPNLALALDAFLMVAMVGGALLGYATRRR